jgi:photosystem II stability/assembly factor-like uncharacterized protein
MTTIRRAILLCFACFLIASEANAQELDGWRKLEGLQDNIRNFTFPEGGRWWAGSPYRTYSSEDQGETWQFARGPVDSPRTAGGHHFFSRDLGYAYSRGELGGIPSTFFRTTNAGESWTETYPGFLPERLQMFDAASGVISGDDIIGFTFDSGRTFRKHEMLPVLVDDVHFVSPEIGYAVGPSTDYFIPGKYEATFQRSNDSGKTWEMVSTGFDEDWWEIYANESGEIFVLGGTNIYRSRDSGTTWNSVGQSSWDGFNDLVFVTDSLGYAVGSHGKFFRTTDAGHSWHKYQEFGSNRFFQIKFADTLIGFLFGDDGVWKTTNGGKAWVPIEPQIFLDAASIRIRRARS